MEVVAGCAVERHGSGEPLVLLHGIGSRRQIWDPVVPALTGVRDVLAVDLPGFGEASGVADVSGPPPSRHPAGSIPALADAVEALCAALDVDRPHVAGNSMGGAVALELGRRGAARSVTAFSPAGFWGGPGLAWCRGLIRGARTLGTRLPAGLVRGVAGAPVARVAVFGAFRAAPGRTGADVLVGDAAALGAATGYDDAAAAFSRLRWADVLGPDGEGPGALDTVPVVVAWGTRDLVLPYRPQAGRARDLLPRAAHRPLPGCGHIPFADDPQACVRALFAASAAVG